MLRAFAAMEKGSWMNGSLPRRADSDGIAHGFRKGSARILDAVQLTDFACDERQKRRGCATSWRLVLLRLRG